MIKEALSIILSEGINTIIEETTIDVSSNTPHQSAYMYYMNNYQNGYSRLVHGDIKKIKNDGTEEMIPHAWIETPHKVIDPSLADKGIQIDWNRDLYYKSANIKKTSVKKYNKNAALNNKEENNSFGPWN